MKTRSQNKESDLFIKKLEDLKDRILLQVMTGLECRANLDTLLRTILIYNCISDSTNRSIEKIKSWPEFEIILDLFPEHEEFNFNFEIINARTEFSGLNYSEGCLSTFLNPNLALLNSSSSSRDQPPLPLPSPFQKRNNNRREAETSPVEQEITDIIDITEIPDVVRHIKKNKTDAELNFLLKIITNLLDNVGAPAELQYASEFLIGNRKNIKPKIPKADFISVQESIKICESLTQVGCLSKGLNVLERAKNNERTVRLDNNIDEIRKLHPFGPQISNDHKSDTQFIVDPETVKKVIMKLPRKSAGAFSFWSFELIKKFTLISSNFFEKVTSLLSHILNGDLFISRHLWTRSRLIGIRKPDGKLRPIAIGDIWLRLASKVAMAQNNSRFSSFFKPHQLGVSIPGGCEIIATICGLFRRHSKNNFVIKSMDISNAFNSIDREAIINVLQVEFHSLVNYFLWSYGSESQLFDSSGKFIGHSYSGVKQGDPAGPALFALGIHKFLINCKELFPDIHIFAYLDDIVFIGPEDKVNQAYISLAEDLKSIKLEHNPSKSTVVHCDPNNLSTTDGAIILGCPIGGEEFITSTINKTFESFTSILPELEMLDAKYFFPIIKYCINSRPSFLTRLCHPDLTDTATLDFDKKVDEAFIRKFKVNPNDWDHLRNNIRHLPCKLGGLGIRYHNKIRSIAHEACLDEVIHFTNKLDSSILADIDLPRDIPVQPPLKQKERLKPVNEKLHEDTIKLLSRNNSHYCKSKKAMFISASNKFTASWMSAGCTPFLPVNLLAEEFIECMKLRLLFSIVPSNYDKGCVCKFDPKEDPFHCFACSKCLEGVNRRHHSINRQLRNFIVSKVGCYANLEQIINHELVPDKNKRADMVVRFENGTQDLVDVTVVHPGAISYCTGKIVPNKGINRGEKRKIADYNKSIGPNLTSLLLPFVIEVPGNFSEKALAFINKICKFASPTGSLMESKFLASKLISILSISLMKYNAQIIQSGRILLNLPSTNNPTDCLTQSQ